MHWLPRAQMEETTPIRQHISMDILIPQPHTVDIETVQNAVQTTHILNRIHFLLQRRQAVQQLEVKRVQVAEGHIQLLLLGTAGEAQKKKLVQTVKHLGAHTTPVQNAVPQRRSARQVEVMEVTAGEAHKEKLAQTVKHLDARTVHVQNAVQQRRLAQQVELMEATV